MNIVPDLSYCVSHIGLGIHVYNFIIWLYMWQMRAETSVLDLQQRHNIEGLLEIVSFL